MSNNEVTTALKQVTKSTDMLIEKIISKHRKKCRVCFFIGIATTLVLAAATIGVLIVLQGGAICFA